MAEFNLPEFSITATTANEDIMQLLKTIKPQWNSEDVKISTISGGLSCSTYRVNLNSNSPEAVTVRVRKLFSTTPLAIVDYDYEKKIVQIVSKLGIFSKIYAMFKNGYCYEYIKGKPLLNWMAEPEKTLNYDDIPFKKIAQKMAQIHCIQLEDADFSKSNIYERYRQTLEENYPDDDVDDPIVISKTVIRKELDEMIEYSKKLNLKVVLCHGDAHPGNMVWNKEENELTFVDWELTHIGYQVHDIEYFLRTFYSFDMMDVPNMPKFFGVSNEKVREKFIQLYVEEYSKLATGSTTVSDEYLKDFSNQVKFMHLMLCLASIIFCGALRHKLDDFDLPADANKVISLTYEIYQRSKDETLHELNLT